MLENPICFVLGHGILDPHRHTAKTLSQGLLVRSYTVIVNAHIHRLHYVRSCSTALNSCDYMVSTTDETDCEK